MTAAQNALILDHMYLVPPIVREVAVRLPAHVNRDDLTSAGMLGLVLAGRSYDDTLGVPFGRWAAFKIRHAITDELRSMDWASRSVRTKARTVETARNQLAVELGRSPTDREVAQAIEVDVAKVLAMDADTNRASMLRLEAFAPAIAEALAADPEPGPEPHAVDRDQVHQLVVALNALPERLRHVVRACFVDERRLADIAGDLAVTESRICQMISEAAGLLRHGLAALDEPPAVQRAALGKKRGRADRYLATLDTLRTA